MSKAKYRTQTDGLTDVALPIIVYIASASRSGSTVLDHFLGGIDGIVGVGEIRRIKDFAAQNADAIRDPANQRGCTCGAAIADCNFWSAVEKASDLSFSATDLSSNMGSANRALFKLLFLVFGAGASRWLARLYPPFAAQLALADNFMRIYAAVAATAGVKCVVDSSKMIHHYLIMKMAYPGKVKLLALYRDGRAVSKSVIRGDRCNYFMGGKYAGNPTGALREAGKYWLKSVVQLLAVYFRSPRSERYLLQYEDFCGRPEFHSRELLERFGVLDSSSALKYVERQSHNIGGSPSRFSFRTIGIGLDEAWYRDWSRKDSRAFGVWCRFMNRVLGYKP